VSGRTAGALCLALALLASHAAAQSRSDRAPVPPTAVVKAGTLDVRGTPIVVDEGTFHVPADRDAVGDATLRLSYVRVPTTAISPGAPIVFLAGGPGDAATRAIAGMPTALLDELRAIADVIAFDQRGTGRSEPRNPVCPPGGLEPRDRVPVPSELLDVLTVRVTECLARAAAAGVFVQGLTTAQSADDLEALRRVLNVPRLSLLAGSYGTHLALAMVRQHPTSVDRLVLLGVEGPDDTFKLPSRVDSVIATIAAARRPSLVEEIRALRARFAASPATFTFPAGQVMVLGEWDLQRWIAESLDTRREIDALLAALPAIRDGEYSVLAQSALRARMPRPLNLMNLAMNCASYATADRLDRIAREAPTSLLGAAMDFPVPALCRVPGLPRLPDAFRAPVQGTHRVLLVSGTFDARTPPVNAHLVAAGFPNHESLVLDHVSHDLFGDARAMRALVAFLSRTH
jgi:pimeloyl-ACP methyl ester carboxylesterase